VLAYTEGIQAHLLANSRARGAAVAVPPFRGDGGGEQGDGEGGEGEFHVVGLGLLVVVTVLFSEGTIDIYICHLAVSHSRELRAGSPDIADQNVAESFQAGHVRKFLIGVNAAALTEERRIHLMAGPSLELRRCAYLRHTTASLVRLARPFASDLGPLGRPR
jgi:hypothetical protein